MIRYRSRRPDEAELRGRLRELANERRRFGYRRLFILLRREGEPSGGRRLGRPADQRLADRRGGRADPRRRRPGARRLALRTLAEFDTPEWAPPEAQQWTAGQITRFGDQITGIVSANDGTAGGAIAALKAAGVDPLPPVTGNDATIAALQLIIAGDQYNSISKPSEIVAEAAANVAVAFLKGETPAAETLAGVHQPSAGSIEYLGRQVTLDTPGKALEMGIATVFQDLALCENLDVVANLFLGHELSPWQLDEVQMEVRAWTLLQELSARIPSVREPIASLSGGQRQTVAVARSLLLDPQVIMLDEPTAALGVAQTAEVLNLIERVRDRGHGVILISHNMEDVRAVADRIVVLRLGRNNGVFPADTSHHELVAAITGAGENSVSRRAARKLEPAEE